MIAAVSQRPTEKSSTSYEQTLLEAHAGHAYQVVREIGRGGMGMVFLARDLKLHRHVAIKVLSHTLSGMDEQRERFRREARVTARLGGDGIVAVHGFGEEGDLVYIVMEYVDGSPLGASLKGKRMAPERVRDMLVSLATTLDRAHAVGVVHRDLKPENILVHRESGRPMITDFGVAISRTLDPLPNSGEKSYGTPHFMSPEQAAGELDLDGRSDIYALGVLGYLLLTGVPPFDADHAGGIVAKHITEPCIPLNRRTSGIPADLAASIERCLAKEPSRRWRRGNDLATALGNPSNSKKRVTPLIAALGLTLAASLVRLLSI
jgi:serine/threonine protein kinase